MPTRGEIKQTKERRKREIDSIISANNNVAVMMNHREFIDFLVVQKKNESMTMKEIIQWFDQVIRSSAIISPTVKKFWEDHKGVVKNLGSYSPVFSDVKLLTALAMEMQRGGKILGKYKVSTYKWTTYIILEGYPGLRRQLTGTRYLANNPKVVSMGLGKLGLQNSIKGGFVFSIFFSLGFHALEQALNEEATWKDFVAGVTVDTVSAITGAGIAWSVVAGVTGGAATVAIGPLLLVVAVGVVTTAVLNEISNYLGLQEIIVDHLSKAETKIKSGLDGFKFPANKIIRDFDDDPIGFSHKLFGIPDLRHIMR